MAGVITWFVQKQARALRNFNLELVGCRDALSLSQVSRRRPQLMPDVSCWVQSDRSAMSPPRALRVLDVCSTSSFLRSETQRP